MANKYEKRPKSTSNHKSETLEHGGYCCRSVRIAKKDKRKEERENLMVSNVNGRQK